jgi:hypothetical protein
MIPINACECAGANGFIERIQGPRMAVITPEELREEIAPGITLDAVTGKVIDAFKTAQAIVDPLAFIQDSVKTIISESSLPELLKKQLKPASAIDVQFKEILLPDKFNHAAVRRERVQAFTLVELCTDYHLRVKAHNEEFTILWPAGITEGFKNTIMYADLQAAYKQSIKSALERADVVDLWKLSKQYELKTTVESYMSSNNSCAEGLRLAGGFLAGKIQSHLVYLNSSRENTPVKVSNAIYLCDSLDSIGLFVFLGGDNAVIELPAVSGQRQEFMERSKKLQEKLLGRIPLQDRLLRVDDDFKYSDPALGIFKFYPRYSPILFDVSHDAVGELYARQLVLVLSDIDTLVSTDQERFTDGLIAVIDKVLTAASIMAIIPGATVFATKGARLAVSFLFGASASTTEMIRGAISDDPNTAERFRSRAYRGYVMEIAGPLAGRLFGRIFSGPIASRIARLTFERIKSMVRKFPGPVKWVPPITASAAALAVRMQWKFKSHRVVSQLQNLEGGPGVAQKLIRNTKIIYFSGPREGYVYQGFVLRGDMRPPNILFEKGFKLRTRITDVTQVNGMRGGFGGGKDALDMDGMGISTSVYYKHSGAGAFQYGGRRGGYTYVVDARQMRGYHLYANDQWKKHPDATLAMRPYEINYAQDIPASAVIGAYDKHGKFIQNLSSLRKSIEDSKPSQLPESTVYRLAKSFVQSSDSNPGTQMPS